MKISVVFVLLSAFAVLGDSIVVGAMQVPSSDPFCH